MAVARRSSNTLTTASRTNSTLTAPSGIANNDVLLAVLAVGDGTALPPLGVTAPAGWTEISASPIALDRPDPYTISLRAWYKVAASESGNYTFTHAAATTAGYIVALTGANTTTPLNPTPTGNTRGSLDGTTTTALGLTTATNDSYVLYAETIWDALGAATVGGTTPTFTERLRNSATLIADGVLASAGPTGDKVRTPNGNSGVGVPWLAFLIAVQAAGAGALTVTGAQTTSATTQAGTIAVIGAVTGAQTTLAVTQSGTITVVQPALNVTGAQTTNAATQTGDITLGAAPALTVTGAQTTLACVTTGTIGEVTPEPVPLPGHGGGTSKAYAKRLRQAEERRRKFEEERFQRLAGLMLERPPLQPAPETMRTIAAVHEEPTLNLDDGREEELLLLLLAS